MWLPLQSMKHECPVSLPKNESAPSLDAGSGQGVVVCGYELSLKNIQSVISQRLINRNIILTVGRCAQAPISENRHTIAFLYLTR